MSNSFCTEPQETAADIVSPRPWRTLPVIPTGIFAADEIGTKVAATKAGHGFPEVSEKVAKANAAFIVEAVNAYDANRELIEQLYAKLTCCCGSYVTDHGMGDGHSPVAMYDYALRNAEERIKQFEEAINLFLQPRMTVFNDSRAVDDDLVALAGVVATDGAEVSMAYLREHANDKHAPLEVTITSVDPDEYNGTCAYPDEN